MIWSIETGQVRQLPTRIKYQFGFRWSPDGRSLITMGTDFRGRRGIYRIDTQTGDSTQVVDGVGTDPEWAADGRSIYYRAQNPRGVLAIVQRDLASGAEREVLSTPADNTSFRLSPDQHSVAYAARDNRDRSVLVIPITGGEPRTVFRSTDPDDIYPASWTPDGRGLLIVKVRAGTPTELWLAPADGAQPRKIEGDISSWTWDGRVRLSPDGKQVTFVHSASKPGSEIWALESFLPRLKAAR
jgi:TolB protein